MALNFASNNSLSAITTLPASISGGGMTLISEQTASSSASISFSLDNSYDKYEFKFIDINAQTNGANFQFNFSTDGGSNYNVTKTSSFFIAQNRENGTNSSLQYQGFGRDLAQSTSDQRLSSEGAGDDNNQNLNGSLNIYNPSSSVFVKHYIGNSANRKYSSNQLTYLQMTSYYAGYGNTTSPINSIIFRMSSGNIDAGTIKMYGVS